LEAEKKTMKIPSLLKTASAVFVFCIAIAVVSAAQTFTSLSSFDYLAGAQPYGSLVQGANGNFYGTTSIGGANLTACANGACGTVFEISPTGKLKTVYSFCAQTDCTDGAQPNAGLLLGNDGSLYGTTVRGGAAGGGEVFKITTKGALTVLHSFEGGDGGNPYAGVVQGTDGNFYGTTMEGGAHGYGTVFKMNPNGTLTTLYNFCSQTNCADGAAPYLGGLVQGTDGNFYGTTQLGGANNNSICLYNVGCGTVFKITSAGTMTTLHNFCSETNCTDGYFPVVGLMRAVDGDSYGTALEGGLTSSGDGTVFRITPAGTLTTLHDFCTQGNCVDGATPYGALVQATDRNIYGTTAYGGSGNGTIFQITTTGTLTTLHSFNVTDGERPFGGLLLATNGKFYGTTYGGGNSNNCSLGCGTVFALSIGLGPFIETQPTAAMIGSRVTILGNNLAGATSVTFNGTPASFTIISNTAITTTVPTGATTGVVKVTTPDGTLNSNVAFRVTP
jgi:uncharacterized repeat protein (TIGR03803 family)